MPDAAGFDWGNLTAQGALVVLVVWSVTKGLPNLLKSVHEDSRQQREDFARESQQQRNDFREELHAHRQQSRELAESGHAAVKALAESFTGLRDELRHQREQK